MIIIKIRFGGFLGCEEAKPLAQEMLAHFFVPKMLGIFEHNGPVGKFSFRIAVAFEPEAPRYSGNLLALPCKAGALPD